MTSTFTLDQAIVALGGYIRDAAQKGLENANTNLQKSGRFEDKFQDGFVQSFSERRDAFPKYLGSVTIECYGRDTDDEARTGADVRITWTHPRKNTKNKTYSFVLYLQIKLLYKSYDHYLNTIYFGKPKIEWSEEHRKMSERFKSLKLGFFDAQYKSQRHGEYFGKYQLLQMQSQMGDFKDNEVGRVSRVAASYLVLDTPQGAGTGNFAKDVILVPVHSFRLMIRGSFHAPLQLVMPTKDNPDGVDDVGSLTAAQLNDVLEYQTKRLLPDPNDHSISKWLSNFIEPDFYMG